MVVTDAEEKEALVGPRWWCARSDVMAVESEFCSGCGSFGDWNGLSGESEGFGVGLGEISVSGDDFAGTALEVWRFLDSREEYPLVGCIVLSWSS